MKYSELPDGNGAGFFGADDVLGTLNRQTPETIAAAASEVQTGKMFSLNAPLDWPDPPLFNRELYKHTVYTTALGNRDDYVDQFYLQASSQWDSFQHFRDPELGFYNEKPVEALGIETWAERGIAGRAVLFDLERHARAQGEPLVWNQVKRINWEVLEEIRSAHGIEPRGGDILIFRTGWMKGYNEASSEDQAAAKTRHDSPGLSADDDTIAYLWDWGLSAMAADNVGVEAMPIDKQSIHARMLSRLGVPLGELLDLESFAEDCAADGRYTAFMTAAPLNLRGGVGSPANALVFK